MQTRSTSDNIRSGEAPVDDCCTACCCCCCSLWLYLFCCRSMKRTLRMKLLWVYMVVLGLTTGVVTGVVIFGSVQTEMAMSDMRVIDKKMSNVFCDSVDIESDSFESKFDAFFMKNTPEILPDIQKPYNESYTQFVEQNSFVTKRFYLLTGSAVTLTGFVKSFTELNLIRGEDNYNNYVDSGKQCMDCVEDSWSLLEDRDNNIHIDIEDTDVYLFVFVSSIEDTWIDMRFSLLRTVYDTSNHLDVCMDTITCVFDYDITDSKTPVVILYAKASKKHHYDEGSIFIETSCVSRSWIFVLIFFGIPTFLSIVISIFIFRRCSDPQPEVTYNAVRSNERTPLLWDTARAPAVVILPPKYEDIIGTDNDLPSYEEATTSTCNVNNQSSNQNDVVQER
ncbi:uncharacterized protein LOC132563317 [Ylistrum balloti]|uniref:uncharacterized protein LOC132563317 n=1 Tax=Ylistrum balloti TaxID=509963 RepID=UPI00290581E9|nr:uncharacterized protein LOC132563317 [Ylistrum balloti]